MASAAVTRDRSNSSAALPGVVGDSVSAVGSRGTISHGTTGSRVSFKQPVVATEFPVADSAVPTPFASQRAGGDGVGIASRETRQSSISLHDVTELAYKTSKGVIQGPLATMLAVMYTFFLFVIMTAQFLGWAPEIRLYQITIYLAVCVIILEVTRFLADVLSILCRFYLTLVPFVFLLVFSREAHVLIGVLWFCFSLVIFLQSGVPLLQLHIMIYVCLFVSAYSLVVTFMCLFYRDTVGTDNTFGRMLSPKVLWEEEAIILCSFALLGMSFLAMERFIKVYAISLVRRSRDIKCLETANKVLRAELKKFKLTTSMNIDSPFIRTLNDIKAMAGAMPQGDAIRARLEEIVNILTSNQLYLPNLDFLDGSLDYELANFLNTLLINDPHVGVPRRAQTMSDSNQSSQSTLSQTANHRKLLQQQAAARIPVDVNYESAIRKILSTVEDWDFNVFEFARATQGRPLYYMSVYLFDKFDLCAKFNIEKKRLERFLDKVERSYRADNPYHNATHACDVLQCMNYFVTSGGLRELVTDLDVFSSFVAAICHDVEHPGKNNSFQISSSSELAVIYNDRSVLENHHAAKTFQIVLGKGGAKKDHSGDVAVTSGAEQDRGAGEAQSSASALEIEEDGNIMAGMSDYQRREARDMVISLILATDMSQHFDILGRFKAKSQKSAPDQQQGQTSGGGGLGANGAAEAISPMISPSMNQAGTSSEERKDRQLLLQVAIKCADVSNPARSVAVSQRWAELVMEEFFRQGDEEKRRGFCVSTFMDRNKVETAKCQVGFIEFIVGPLFEAFVQHLSNDETLKCIENLGNNLSYWRGSAAKEALSSTSFSPAIPSTAVQR